MMGCERVSNLFEKIFVKWNHFPKGQGENNTYLKPPPGRLYYLDVPLEVRINGKDQCFFTTISPIYK